MAKLTPDVLKNTKAEAGKRLELRDDDEPGLIFRITDAGKRSWSLRYTNIAGEHRRQTIGPYPSIGLAKAREEARKIRGAVAGGTDTVGEARRAKAQEELKRLRTFDGLATEYFEAAVLGLHKANAGPKRASTIGEERRVYDKHVKPKFGILAVADIKRADVQALVTKLSKDKPSNGRHARNIIRQLMSFALSHELIDANPALSIAVVSSVARERTLTDDELKAIWNACDKPADVKDLALSRDMALAVQLAMVTLQRGGEVIGMAWAEIDRKRRLWVIPASRMKGKRSHAVPLSDLALDLLDTAQSLISGETFVFQSGRKSTEGEAHFDRRAFTRAMKRLTTALGIPNATLHDLRRTGATTITSERIGIPRFIVSQVLAHAGDTGGSAAVTGRHYDLNDYLVEKRRALDAWAGLLQSIITGQDRSANVVPLKA